jgi:hypothetical protein
MKAERFQIKLFATNPALDIDAFVPVFHRYISERVLPEVPVDVVHYGHVHQGPGVVLVVDGAEYYVDEGEGRAGLLYYRKRRAPAEGERLTDALRRVVNAAVLLEQEPSLSGQVKFGAQEILVRVTDRLNAPPGSAEALAALRAELEATLSPLLGAGLDITNEGRPGEAITFRVRAPNALSLPALLEKLGGAPKLAA